MMPPVEILADLSDHFFSPELARLVRHIRAALKGGESLERAVALAAEDMDEKIATAAEEAVESAPTRLIIPMAVLLLAPAMVLVFFPIADNLLNSLSMTSGAF
jgi:Flp pilus assembly protein TadB